MNTQGLCLLLIFAASAFGDICKPVDRLQAVSQSYKIHMNHAMFGLLGACPPMGEQLDQTLQYRITEDSDAPGVRLLDSRTGEFTFEPAYKFVGVVSFFYTVSDSQGRTSSPVKVTIQVRNDPAEPLLELLNIRAETGTYAPLRMSVSMEEGMDGRGLTVMLCDCDQVLECSRDTGRCHCDLSLPHGWELADGLRRRLLNEELKNLSASQLPNLTLKTQMNSAAEYCLEVHAINWNVATQEPLSGKGKVFISITPPSNTVPNSGSPTGVLQLETSEGQVIRFGGLHVGDTDNVQGTYRVQVSLDQGGTLWVKQDEVSDVIFFPKESDSPEWFSPNGQDQYRKLDRFGNFYDNYEPYNTEATNNGKKQLSFVGSIEGINRVLSSMVFVPWCPKWPTPPNWNLPESSWMDPSNHDELMSNDPLKPVIWPQWYPRFWYPFPRKHWTWWPHVMPPWWLNQTCSDWTSHVHLEMHEVTPETCDVERDVDDRVEWDAEIHVKARTSQPKSIIADNLFTYFSPDDESFLMRNLYIRSKEETFHLKVTLEVVEKQFATITHTDTGKAWFTCTNVPDCNDKFQKIQVQFLENITKPCNLTIEIRMYQDDSYRLSDYMMLWAYKTTPECINYLYHDLDATLEPSQSRVPMWQGETAPLDLRFTADIRKGVLHTEIYAEHGLVTVTAPDGLRVYKDHMGQHGGVPSFLCISGPTDMVLEALLTAKFTPFKNFRGETTVKVAYTVPYFAIVTTYGAVDEPPMRSAVVTFEVTRSSDRPYLPLLKMPSKDCMSESDLLPLDMMRIEGRYQEDEGVTLSLVALKGNLIIEQSRIPELYACPKETYEGPSRKCVEECGYHTACPRTQMCCYQGCSRVCTESQQVATIHSQTPQNVIIHGNISTVNRILEAENVWYLAKPCQTDDEGGIVTDRVIETQEDVIRIQIVPARNPEGDSVFGTLFVQISCLSLPEQPSAPAETAASDCRDEWGAWLDCQLDEGAICGRGRQVRQGRCGVQELRQERPCMICGCAPVEAVLSDLSGHMRGCISDLPIKRCPPGCDIDIHHTEVHSFHCAASVTNEDVEMTPQDQDVLKTKNIDVHDSCICSTCLTHQ